jgi:hypothetical protein
MLLKLFSWTGEYQGAINWNEEEGTITGDIAPEVLEILLDYKEQGWAPGDPPPRRLEIVDPLRFRRDMAICLCTAWRLPQELAKDYPPPEGSGTYYPDVQY